VTRGRKPKPRGLRVLQGNPGKRPLPADSIPAAAAIPTAPEHLSEAAKAEWESLARSLHRVGILGEFDRAAFGAYCEALARWAAAQTVLNEMAKNDPRGGLLIKAKSGIIYENPLVGIARRAALDTVRFAAECGMTPSARTRVTATPPPEKENPFLAIMRGRAP